MRIGILTQALHGNYGGILQNYALQQVLKQMGHTPVTVDRHLPRSESRIKNLAKTLLRNLHSTFDSGQLTTPEKRRLNSKQLDFVERNIDRIGPIVSQSEFDVTVKEESFGAFIVGSDQCWRPCYSANIANYFLDFASDRDVKRIVYAASFGVDKWEYTEEQTSKVRDAAKKLEAVSVREGSGVELCSKYLDVEAKWVLDPTMLLGVERFRPFVKESGDSPTFLTEYLLEDSSENDAMIRRIQKLSGIGSRCNNNNAKSFRRFTPLSRYENISIEDWISNIANAKIVVTDSFHGAVFSILFNVPFVIKLNGTRGNARIESLLKDFGLESCIYRGNDFRIPEIDWREVNNHLEVRRIYSYTFLKQALS